MTCTTPPFRAAVRLNSGVRSCQCKFSREKRLSLASRSCSAPLRSRFTHNSPPSARITRGAPDFIRRRPSRFSCCHAVLRGSHAGARGNKPCRVYLRACVRFDGVKAGSQQKRPAGHDLTIRSSRVRFAASSRCGKLVHLAVAAPLPGLAQALDRARRRVRSTSVRLSRRAAFPRLAQTFDPRHKLRAGKNAGTPFLGSAFQSEIIGNSWPGRSQAQIVGSTLGSGHRCWLRATAGTGLTIRSSRHRFAASCKVLAIKPDTPPQSGAS